MICENVRLWRVPFIDCNFSRFLNSTFWSSYRSQSSASIEELLGNKEFEKARTIFLRLGSYVDAAEKASACVYEPTLQLIEDGLYDEAITALSGISGYQDSRELIPDYLRFGPVNALRLFHQLTEFPSLERLLRTSFAA